MEADAGCVEADGESAGVEGAGTGLTLGAAAAAAP